MWKRTILIIIVVSNIFLLSGCWNYTELDEHLNVSGLAIDVGENGKKYHLTAEILLAGEGKDSQITAKTLETDGNTMFEAIRNLITISARKLYFGHCKVLVISEKLAEKGITEIFDMMIRDHELRLDIDIAISKACDAKEIFSCESIGTTGVSYEINDLLKTTVQYVGEAPTNISYKIYNSLSTEGSSTVIPSLELSKVEENDALKFNGVGVFNKDKLIGYLDPFETQSLSFIKNKITVGLLTVSEFDTHQSFEIFSNKTQVIPKNDHTKLSVDINTKTKVNVGEVQSEANFANNNITEKTRKHLERKMEEKLSHLINKAQSELCIDIFGIGNQIYQNDPKLWDEYKNDWDKIFKKLDINVDCKVEIMGSGITEEFSK